MPHRCFRLLALLAAVPLSVAASAQIAQPDICTNPLASPTAPPAAITIVANNGNPIWKLNKNTSDPSSPTVTWTPQGVGIKAFIASAAYLTNSSNQSVDGVPGELKALQAYGTNEMTAAKNFGADTLRYQVSQYALAHDSGNAFHDCLQKAVRVARNAGLFVVLAVQSENDGQDNDHTALPTVDTWTALSVLNTLYKSNQGVMLELYNEPPVTNWLDWKCGSHDGAQAIGQLASYNACIAASPASPASGLSANSQAIGMQILADALRANGSTNIIVVDAPGFAHSLNGIVQASGNNYFLKDSAHSVAQIAYALHPYPRGKDRSNCYSSYFGYNTSNYPSATLPVPVIVSEWSAETSSASSGPMLNGLSTFHPSVSLVDFMNTHAYPMLAGAFDVGGILTTSVPADTAAPSAWLPTNYDNFYAGNPPNYKSGGLNAGLLLRTDFLTHGSLQGQQVAFHCQDAVDSGDTTSTCSNSLWTAPAPTPPAIDCSE